MTTRREKPVKRINPSGKTRWVARWTDQDGHRQIAGTYGTKYEAQEAIDAAYERERTAPRRPDTLAGYARTWTSRHPRSDRTNTTNESRLRAVLGVRIDGIKLGEYAMHDLRRRHATELVNVLLTDQGRAAAGAQNVMRVLSAMIEDAIGDECCEANPFRGVRIRANDPRVSKAPRAPIVLTWEQSHAFAAHAGRHEAMVRVLADCGLRLGEMLALERRGFEPGLLHVRGTAHEGRITPSSDTKSHDRVVPLPAATEALIRAMAPRIDTPLLFATSTGKVWRERNWYRDVWDPARAAAGVDCTPHDLRHSWVTQLRAAGVDPADLAAIAGHSEDVAGRYTHALGRSHDDVRRLVG